MKITINNFEREVTVRKEGKTWICKVGNAVVYWRKEYTTPYVLIPGKRLEEVQKAKPKIVEFLKEYKRLVIEASKKEAAALSFEGEGQTNTAYKYQPIIHDNSGYVSSIPKWLREVKIKQVCSGPIRTFTRGIRIPQEYKDMAIKYMPHCSHCQHRVECDAPCLSPEVNSNDELLVGIETA